MSLHKYLASCDTDDISRFDEHPVIGWSLEVSPSLQHTIAVANCRNTVTVGKHHPLQEVHNMLAWHV